MTIDTDAELVVEIRKVFDEKNGDLAPGLNHKIMGYGLEGWRAWKARRLCLKAALALGRLLNLAEVTNDWISVKELPPDHAEPVVYARPKGNGKWSVGIAYWTVSQKWFPEPYGVLAPRGFTYYKPLGTPPIEEKP